jgi:hypothetical protein
LIWVLCYLSLFVVVSEQALEDISEKIVLNLNKSKSDSIDVNEVKGLKKVI